MHNDPNSHQSYSWFVALKWQQILPSTGINKHIKLDI